MSRVIPLIALVVATTLTSCADEPGPTGPRRQVPAFTTYAVTVGPPAILEGFDEWFLVTARAINDLGDAVGSSHGGSSGVRASLWPSGSTVPIDFAGLTTQANAINLTGQIGGWFDPNATLWTPAGGGAYSVTNIGGQLPGAYRSIVFGINDYGQAVGYYNVIPAPAEPLLKCFLWTPSIPNGTTGSAITLPDFGNGCSAYEINAAGYVVGTRTTTTGELRAFLWSPTTPNGTVGAVQDLATGANSVAVAINDALQIGGSRTIGGVSNAAIWTPTDGGGFTVTDLGTFTGSESLVSDINNAGFVVGTARVPSLLDGDAFFWQNGVFTKLPEIGTLDAAAAAAMTNISGTLVRVVGSAAQSGTVTARTALRWDVIVAPATPTGCLAQLVQAVEDLEVGGSLSPGAARSLIGKVNAAAQHVSQGRQAPARNLASAVIAEVQALVASGRLTSAEAQPLIDAATCVIDGL